MSFRPDDLKPEKEELNPATIETTDAITKTKTENAGQGVELLSAMLERYNPEDFITFHVVGKVTPVQGKEDGKEDFVQVLVEVSFNDKLYNEAFIPDLKQVLDVIAAKKKDITLTKQRDVLRRISGRKGAPLADNSIVLTGAGLGKEFSLAVYDKPDRFGCRLYAFKKEDADKILNNATGILAQFRARIASIKGFEIELLGENDEIVDTSEQKITLPFLLTDSVIRDNVWAFHPSLMHYQGMYNYVPLYLENTQTTIPLQFELPEEFQKLTRNIKANLMTEEDYADAWLKTRKGLHDTALNFLTKGEEIARSSFDEAAESEYPLAMAALQNIEAAKIMSERNNLLLEEVVDRLEEGRNAGNYAAIYDTFLRYEEEVSNFDTQKKCLPYLTQAAMIHPEAMIRMGEVQEQGFYGVKANPKKAKAYYDEGTRILSLMASQGLPCAAAALGHVYLEGLGTKQDTPRAEKTGYYDPEFWVWEHYGVSMRQIAFPENFSQAITYDNNKHPRTGLYLIREKEYVYRGRDLYWNYFPVLDVKSTQTAWWLMNYIQSNKSSASILFEVIYLDGEMVRTRTGKEISLRPDKK